MAVEAAPRPAGGEVAGGRRRWPWREGAEELQEGAVLTRRKSAGESSSHGAMAMGAVEEAGQGARREGVRRSVGAAPAAGE